MSYREESDVRASAIRRVCWRVDQRGEGVGAPILDESRDVRSMSEKWIIQFDGSRLEIESDRSPLCGNQKLRILLGRA
jgi:hypothetical protein